MRTAFFEALYALARRDPRILFITGDLGFGVARQFMTELPAQFLNVGVAEQNMTGLAAGLALSGKIAVTYSIANFPVLRCFEQIRNDICYHKANVKIVAVGGGLAYGSLGASHHATEDLALMRSLPNMTVVAPNDPVEARFATHAIVADGGPCYLRLGRDGEPPIHREPPEFVLGKAIRLREGTDLTLIASTGLGAIALEAADRLQAHGLRARVLSMHTIKPLDRDAVVTAAVQTGAIFSVEEHSVIGGLGSAVAEVLAESDVRAAVFRRVGLPDCFTFQIGDQNYLRARHGLNAEGIAATVAQTLGVTQVKS